ncbi:hypothetical protein ELI30_19770 [Rhizobium leguminosarum]|uniref:hypothetical protein n=1 Tax=Rhizobium leguminosarum TaxID=384 RepID=UPI00103072DA|nr:hypothetical protein [Rhizobium leguminosarum]TAV50391.1 hypothetical protein ELI32_20470 [Rhizobium leguminosarum]TAV59753.1 hypothetical protein ELI31_18995 [Rhizobium leguminosarum]TAV70801.1 hypothetical protein ELI30_19770 [Rhizobium leguminosarum]TAY68420.1 hypothetical protein ELH82_20660 [Rhizobium leguminosarum]
MGSMKDPMDAVDEGLLVNFACPNPDCQNILEYHVEDAAFDFSTDRHADGIGYAETRVVCEECQDEFEVVVLATGVGKEVTIKGFPNSMVEFVDNSFEQEYDDFLAEYNPEDPFGVYNATIRELDNLHHGSTIMPSAVRAFNKMVCLWHIIAVETYLSDRLIKIVTNDSDKLLALVGGTPALRDITPKLIDVAKDPNFVAKYTKDYLQRFSFHNLASVAGFYKAVLKINLFENDEHEKELLDIIKMRHDLVHRSGRNNEGKDVVIDDEHVTILKGLMTSLVTRIEAAHNAYAAKRASEVVAGALLAAVKR